MPGVGSVIPLNRSDLRTAGDFLRAVRQGSCAPVDVVVVPVEAGGVVTADGDLDGVLAAGAQEVARVAQLTGKAGQATAVAAKVGDATVKVAFIGVGDRSPSALRRAGGELGRMLRPGESAVTAAVVGQPAKQVRALTEGIVLGSYRYSERSSASPEPAKAAEVRLMVPAGGAREAPAGAE